MDVIQARSVLDTQCDCVQTLTGEELIISKLISIENRITTIETSMIWFKFIARGSVILIFGFFGLDLTGVI